MGFPSLGVLGAEDLAAQRAVENPGSPCGSWAVHDAPPCTLRQVPAVITGWQLGHRRQSQGWKQKLFQTLCVPTRDLLQPTFVGCEL